MNLNNLIEGIQILQKYYNTPGGYHVSSWHETICLYATDRPLNQVDSERMLELGWNQENYSEDDGEYDVEEGWYAYV